MLARARRRGSALRCENSDGKPCSGVRGDHEVSTAQQTRQDHAVPVREAVFCALPPSYVTNKERPCRVATVSQIQASRQSSSGI